MKPGNGVLQLYERYGGLSQTQPLTEEDRLYDDTCREIDKLELEIGEKRLGLFKANELSWFLHFVNKMHMFPKQAQLDRQKDDLKKLLADLNARS